MEAVLQFLADNGASGALIVVILKLNNTLNRVETRLQLLEADDADAKSELEVIRNKFNKVYETFRGVFDRLRSVEKDVGVLDAKCNLRHGGKA